MEICHKDKHMACFYYGKGKGKDALIEMLELPLGTMENISLSSHEIVFLVKGRLSYAVFGYDPVELTEGNLTFVPIGITVSYEAKAECRLFIIRQANGLRLCHAFSIEQLYDKSEAKDMPEEIIPLEFNPRLSHFLSGLMDTYTDGLLCSYFFEAKITELFVLLRNYYSDEQLYRLFRPILSPDTEFSEFIRRNHHKYKTINDMADELHLTPVQFSNRFRKVFLQTPREWMQNEKAKRIYTEICSTNNPLKQISDEYGFAVQAHLNRFCKKTFGMTPGEMREKKFEWNKNGANKY